MSRKTFQFDFLLEYATQEQAENFMLAIVAEAHKLGCTIGGGFEEYSPEDEAKELIQALVKKSEDEKVDSLFEGLDIPSSEIHDEELQRYG